LRPKLRRTFRQRGLRAPFKAVTSAAPPPTWVAWRFVLELVFDYATCMRTGEGRDPDVGRPIAAPLEQCAELLGIDLTTVRKLAVNVEPYLRADGIRIWSLMQLERQLRPEAFGRRRGGYIDRRRTQAAGS
jgi:hypothetical protein